MLTGLNRKRVFDYAAEHYIPALYENHFRWRVRAARCPTDPKSRNPSNAPPTWSARIFKGAQPADLPFEQPTRYLFVVNLKTAKATGIQLPVNLVALADEVIE